MTADASNFLVIIDSSVMPQLVPDDSVPVPPPLNVNGDAFPPSVRPTVFDEDKMNFENPEVQNENRHDFDFNRFDQLFNNKKGNDLNDFLRADVEKKKETIDEVKEIIQKTKINKTEDFYITSAATTIAPFSSTIGRQTLLNDTFPEAGIFVHLEQKKAVKYEVTTTAPHLTTKPKHSHSITCVHIEDLKKIDSNSKSETVKKGTIEVSVDIDSDGVEKGGKQEEIEEEEEGVKDSDEGEEEAEETEEEDDIENVNSGKNDNNLHFRNVRQQKPTRNLQKIKWKKYEMRCDKEEDEKGSLCKQWASSGLCSKHKPTQFLFCRKTCLCVGP